MKKSVLLAIFCLYSFSALADRCVLNLPNVIQPAVQQLQNIKTVVHYCPTCLGDNHLRHINISDLNILQEGTGQIIQVDGNDIDLAYIYLPTDNTNIYHNLGYIVHCGDLTNSPVREYLDITHPYGIETIENLSSQLEQCHSLNCTEKIYQDTLKTYFDTASNTLKSFPSEQIALPKIISKAEVQKLLTELAYYYGVTRD